MRPLCVFKTEKRHLKYCHLDFCSSLNSSVFQVPDISQTQETESKYLKFPVGFHAHCITKVFIIPQVWYTPHSELHVNTCNGCHIFALIVIAGFKMNKLSQHFFGSRLMRSAHGYKMPWLSVCRTAVPWSDRKSFSLMSSRQRFGRRGNLMRISHSQELAATRVDRVCQDKVVLHTKKLDLYSRSTQSEFEKNKRIK